MLDHTIIYLFKRLNKNLVIDTHVLSKDEVTGRVALEYRVSNYDANQMPSQGWEFEDPMVEVFDPDLNVALGKFYDLYKAEHAELYAKYRQLHQ